MSASLVRRCNTRDRVEAAGVVEVFRDIRRSKHLRRRPAPDDAAFAHVTDGAAHAVEIAPDVGRERADFGVGRG